MWFGFYLSLASLAYTSTFFGLGAMIFRPHTKQNLILAGLASWLFTALFFYGLMIYTGGTTFTNPLIMFIPGAAIWTIVAVLLRRNGTLLKLITTYIPIVALIYTIYIIL